MKSMLAGPKHILMASIVEIKATAKCCNFARRPLLLQLWRMVEMLDLCSLCNHVSEWSFMLNHRQTVVHGIGNIHETTLWAPSIFSKKHIFNVLSNL